MDEILLSRIRKEAYEQGYQDGMVEGYNLAGAKLFKRKKGTWLPYEFGTKRWHKCSACGIADEYINEKGLEARREFCPHCGAQMEERRGENG